MNRTKEDELKKWDIESFDDEELQIQIDRQLEQYNQFKSRSGTIIQFLIAVGAVIVTFASGQVFETSQLIIDFFTTGGAESASGVPWANSEDYLAFSGPISGLILLVGVLTISDTILWANDVLTHETLEPLLGRQNSLELYSEISGSELYEISPLDHKRDRLEYAVLINNTILERMSKCLGYNYLTLGMGIIIISSAGTTYLSGLSGSIRPLLILSLTTTLIILMSVIVFIIGPIASSLGYEITSWRRSISQLQDVSPNPMRHIFLYLCILFISVFITLPFLLFFITLL